MSKLRLLYVLALVQLLGGPLVLWQVTVFCRLAIHETPHLGVAQAIAQTWQSDDFQDAVASADGLQLDPLNSLPLSRESKLKLKKAKLPIIPWEPIVLAICDCSTHLEVTHFERISTPAWPQAPPGPPPRVG